MVLPTANLQEHPLWIYNPSADIQEYPEWIHGPEFRRPCFDGDPRSRRSIFPRLQQALPSSGGHRPYQWGFAIIRTAYGPGSDEQFQHALTLIGRIAQENNMERLGNISMEVDTRPNHEFTRRYQNDILEDKQQLDGASVATVLVGNVRFTTCIMLDAETLVQLAEEPQGLGLDCNSSEFYRSQYWVKMVDAESEYEEAFSVFLYAGDCLIEYQFDTRRLVVHRKNRDNPGVLYYGFAPQELTPHEQAIQDAFKAHMKQGAGI
ncbi:hypothetical protein FGADI_3282 [Fusarium gaditjirri]|uniref:Uncharacterized protein n=1 Tax=Fusarium gaditjirri TaxID=282569 RepID=A0A8H4TG05_9HYPO|nr:hypothetical protein FGADI_3282 [Fusarium gaditjirri]